MGKENNIRTKTNLSSHLLSRGGGTPVYNLKQSAPKSPYSYGMVTFINSKDKSIRYSTIEDNVVTNKIGFALPLYPNKTQVPDLNYIVPLVKAPTIDASQPGGSYNKVTYYLDPIGLHNTVDNNAFKFLEEVSNNSFNNTTATISNTAKQYINNTNFTPSKEFRKINPYIQIIFPSNPDDTMIYEEILTGIKAPITSENLKFFYAWHQAEANYTCNAAWNPFNSKYGKDFFTTNFNSDNVKNYASRVDGINATIKALTLSYYDKIRNGLINNVGAEILSSYFDELEIWGTGNRINGVLVGKIIDASKKPIQRNICQIK